MGNIEMFEFMASQYDTPERDKIAKVIADATREQLNGGKYETAIDYGCGTGLVGLRLLDDFSAITLIDASSAMVGQVRQKIERLHAKNAETLCCNLALEYRRDLKADYIFVVQTLLHEKNIEKLLGNLYSVLNTNGRLIIVDFNKNENITSHEVHNGFDQSELAEVLRRLSFKNIVSRTIYCGEKMFMNQDASLFILDAAKP